MISYELAKKLKEAGFSQAKPYYEGRDSWVDPENTHCNNLFNDAIYCPDLSELIHACGDGFEHLSRSPDGGFLAVGKFVSGSKGILQITPEEAVAHLWLTLSSK